MRCYGEQLVAAERMRQQGKLHVGQSAGQHHGDEGPVAGGGGAEKVFDCAVFAVQVK